MTAIAIILALIIGAMFGSLVTGLCLMARLGEEDMPAQESLRVPHVQD